MAIQSGRHVKTVIGDSGSMEKAGAAYVFLDDCYPGPGTTRFRRNVVTGLSLPRSTSQTFIWNRTMNTRTSPRREDKPFWCIPLTPRPCLKGVMIEHRNITGSVNVSTDWGLTNRMWSVSLQASALWLLFMTPAVPWHPGAAMEIIPEYRRKNIDLIVRFYQEKHITITFLPHMAMKFMKYDESRLNLRALLVGSEPTCATWSRRATELLMYAAQRHVPWQQPMISTAMKNVIPLGH